MVGGGDDGFGWEPAQPGRYLADERDASFDLARADADPYAAAGLQADLREGANPRPICRELLLRHIRGDLLDTRLERTGSQPDAIARAVPRWVAVLAALAPVVAVGWSVASGDGG